MKSQRTYLFLIFCLLLYMPGVISAQSLRRVSQKEAAKMIRSITASNRNIKELECSFKQVSKMSFMDEESTSLGNFSFHSPNSITWAYTKPYQYSIIYKGNKMTTKSGKHVTVTDVSQNRMYRSISGMMSNVITGKSLNSNSDFRVVMYKKGKTWIANLTPKKQDMKKMLKTLWLHFNNRRCVNKLVMQLNDTDKVTVNFYDIKVISK